jgi:hypothetical protein
VNCNEQVRCQAVFQGFPGPLLVRLKNEGEMIEAGVQDQVQVVRVGKFQPIAEQPGYLAVGLGAR